MVIGADDDSGSNLGQVYVYIGRSRRMPVTKSKKRGCMVARSTEFGSFWEGKAFPSRPARAAGMNEAGFELSK